MITQYASPLPRWKRATDIVVCLLAMPVFALLTFFMSILTWLCAPGPLFFRQERIGFRRQRFQCYKFRSMAVRPNPWARRAQRAKRSGAKDQTDDQLADLVIPCGWFLRTTGLDELPQIINVLRGEMSLVGPRAIIPNEVAEYQPWQMERFETPPGLTGLWQVSARSRTPSEEMLQYDVEYVRAKSWRLDLWILCRTVPAMLAQVQRQSDSPVRVSNQD